MRDNVEDFILQGGNVAFFGGIVDYIGTLSAM
jgi:hypothetical protein